MKNISTNNVYFCPNYMYIFLTNRVEYMVVFNFITSPIFELQTPYFARKFIWTVQTNYGKIREAALK